MLVCPEEGLVEQEEDSDLKKHVLSPQLVNAISSSAKVLWTNSHNQEGLLGRSDARLQTAVGMPVAVDGNGNMCVVVMFSPNQIQKSDDAMEYLQSISQSATSTSIPCLMPVFSDMQAVIPASQRQQNLLTNSDGGATSIVNHNDPNASVHDVSFIKTKGTVILFSAILCSLCFVTDRRVSCPQGQLWNPQASCFCGVGRGSAIYR
jgi:hypothetical protein